MSINVSLIPIAALALLISGCSNDSPPAASSQPAAENSGTKPVSDNYTLRATDLLHIEMYMEQDFKFELSVSPEGDIDLPLINRQHVAGKTLKQVRQELTEKYKAFFQDPNLIILIQRYAERKVYVDGFVNNPGPVLFPPEETMTISRAIAGARGIQPRGERTDITVTRMENGALKVIKVNMNDVSLGRAPDIEIKENDRIYVRDSII